MHNNQSYIKILIEIIYEIKTDIISRRFSIYFSLVYPLNFAKTTCFISVLIWKYCPAWNNDIDIDYPPPYVTFYINFLPFLNPHFLWSHFYLRLFLELSFRSLSFFCVFLLSLSFSFMFLFPRFYLIILRNEKNRLHSHAEETLRKDETHNSFRDKSDNRWIGWGLSFQNQIDFRKYSRSSKPDAHWILLPYLARCSCYLFRDSQQNQKLRYRSWYGISSSVTSSLGSPCYFFSVNIFMAVVILVLSPPPLVFSTAWI